MPVPGVDLDYRDLVDGWADLTTVVDADGRYRYVSAACRPLFGWERSDLHGRAEADFVHPDDLAALQASRAECAAALPALATLRFRCGDGHWCWTEVTSRQVLAGGASLVVCTIRDITEREKHVSELVQRASTDPLTGVANRSVLMDRLGQGLRRLSRVNSVLAVLYLDLDRFKVLNDSLGHQTGDEVLRSMATRLTRQLRSADTLARLGGDEFVVVAEGIADEAAALELAHRIVQAGRESFRVGAEEFLCTVSVGVATTTDPGRAAQDLVHDADLALYRAKERGRDRAEVFDEALRLQAVSRLVTERMLRRAVEEERVVVQYQPIIDLRSGRAVRAEALARIHEGGNGLLAPASFLSVAEEAGLLIAIDERVLASAVREAAAWRTRLVGSRFEGVSVNISARHLADAGFYPAVLALLDDHHVPHSDLQLEVTERLLLEAPSSAIAGLRALRDAGVRVGLDDFGTGLSSLTYLRRYPLDFVKIDKDFVHDLEHDQHGRAVAAAIITLSHALGLTVVAEGVESAGQRKILENLDCDQAQGFLWAGSGVPGAVDRFFAAVEEDWATEGDRGVGAGPTPPGGGARTAAR